MATELLGIGGQTVELKLTKFDKRLIMRNRAETVYNRFPRKGTIGRGQGKAISFRRNEIIYSAGNASSLANASAPGALTEGTFPAAIDSTWSEVQATISQYGQVILVSDLTEDQSIDDVAGDDHILKACRVHRGPVHRDAGSHPGHGVVADDDAVGNAVVVGHGDALGE